jgi:tetratricopeptide (TPR) repeat protein
VEIPHREELERRLGPPYSLDGSFASVWAIERLLETVRRIPAWRKHVAWLPDYLADFFTRAYAEMGIHASRVGNSIECENIQYKFDLGADVTHLMENTGPMATFYGCQWLGLPVMGRASLPYYAFATLAQNQAWADSDHDLIGRKRDHLDRLMPWLIRDTLAGIVLPPGLSRTDAEGLVAAVLWPPLGYHMNDHGELNLDRIVERVKAVQDHAALRPFMLSLATSQNYFVRLVAAMFCLRFADCIPNAQPLLPQTREAALAYQDALEFQSITGSAELRAVLARFLPDDEAALQGRTDLGYIAYGEALQQNNFPEALRHLEGLVSLSPENPMFLCSRGHVREQLGQHAQALSDYTLALKIYPRYWQARINRGVFHSRNKHFPLADADLLEAAAIRYGDGDARNNLLCNLYFQWDAELKT